MESKRTPFIRLSSRRFALLLLLGALFSLLLIFLCADFAGRTRADDMAATARERLVIYSGMIYSALNKYGYLPHIMATHPTVRRPLIEPGDSRSIDIANRYLENINTTSGSMDLFILNMSGLCVAASNWNEPGAFVGQNYNYRPYYRDAVRLGKGRYFGVGATTGRPGFFFTEQIIANGKAVGVVVTKVNLAMLQREWRDGGETVFITDAHGIIFLSSRDEWRYRTTRPLDDEDSAAILYQRQYGQTVPPALDVRFAGKYGQGSMAIGEQTWLYTTRPLPEYGWTIWFLSPLATLETQQKTVWLIGLGIASMALLLLVLFRVLLAWSSARRTALEAEKIRTVNRRLEEEIRIRKNTEQDLLAAQDDLLHAGRMTALGQMAASLTHELSQPITTMTMFASSCRRFIEEGRLDKAVESVTYIERMLQRIKLLIEQLKQFSRKSLGKPVRVSVGDALRNALTVVRQKEEDTGCKPVVRMPQDVSVMGNALQLEQVLINLILNALDAVGAVGAAGAAGADERQVTVDVSATDDTVIIAIADSGPGISPAVRDKIFTPFFTTKNSGEGIGLGLAIVDNIIRSWQGTIDVTNRLPRGTCFTLFLPRAGSEQPSV